MFGSAVGVLALFFAFYKCAKLIPRYLKWRRMRAIPGPESGFWLGQTPAIRREPFFEPHKRWWKDLGPDARVIRYSQVMGNNSLLILDKEIIREILTAPASKNNSRFKKSVFQLPIIIGYGLVTLDGEEWAKHRRIIQPAFSVAFLKEALGISVPPKVQRCIQYWLDAGERQEQEIDLGAHLSALTLDVIGDAGFSYDTSGLNDIEAWSQAVNKTSQEGDETDTFLSPELTDPLVTSMMAFLKPNIFRLILFVTGFLSLDPFINPASKNICAALDSTVTGIISNAKRLNDDQKRDSSKAKSLLQLLLKARDSSSDGKNALTDKELKDEVKTFLLAGHETTSTWCHWALYAMAKNPDVQEKVFHEVTKNLKDPKEKTVSLEEVESMEYLSAFLDEVLRIYPPVGMIVRTACYNETLAGYKVLRGTNLVIPIHLLHRNPKYWTDPETFKPERWMQGDYKGSSGMDSRGFSFLPFGAGGHNCIGYKFATLETKLIMAHIVRTLRVEIAPSQRETRHTFTNIVTMKAKPGLKVVFKARKAVDSD